MEMKIIPDIVNEQDVVSLIKTATIHDAVQAMSRRNIAAVAIIDSEKKLIGIISERDLTHRVLACGLSPQSTYLSDIMTKDLETLHPTDNALDAIQLMLGRNIRHLPVVDSNHRIVAMVSMRDLLKAALRNFDIDIDKHREAAFAPASV